MKISWRFSAWLTVRYGDAGRLKPRWAWLVECSLYRVRPRAVQRRLFFGPSPVTVHDG